MINNKRLRRSLQKELIHREVTTEKIEVEINILQEKIRELLSFKEIHATQIAYLRTQIN